MENKICKKQVDSITEQKTQCFYVLDLKKDSRKRIKLEAFISKNETEKNLIWNFHTRFSQSVKEPMPLYSVQRSAMKITAMILIISLNWLGISAIGKTTAYFFDAEISHGNTFSTGTLDFSLTSPTDGFVPQDKCSGQDENDDIENGDNSDRDDKSDDCKNDQDVDNDDNDDGGNWEQGDDDIGQDNDSKEIQNDNEDTNNNGKKNHPDDQETNNGNNDEYGNESGKSGFLSREIRIMQEGSMSFQYAPSIRDISGNSEFCDSLILKAEFAGDMVYLGDISNFDFESSPFVLSDKGKDVWNFIIGFSAADEENDEENDKEYNGENSGNNENSNNKFCRFNFSFRAWQIDLGPEYGFGTEKIIGNIIESNSHQGDQESDDDENGNYLQIGTSLTTDDGSEDSGNSGNSEADDPIDSEENSAETGENSLHENTPDPVDELDAPSFMETPEIYPAKEDNDI